LLLCKFLTINLNGQELNKVADKSNYRQLFQEHYNDALQFLENNPWISDSIQAKGIDPKFALSIIFPELIRYSSIRDKMELSGLFTLYIQYGEKYADFSVGRFQMKPSFAEQLENDANNTPEVAFTKFNVTKTSQARIERVKRLGEMEGQVNYLVLFIRIMEHRNKNIMWDTEIERLMYYATAYNSGYNSGEKKIRDRVGSKMFYTGLLKVDSCYCYGSIARYFYKTWR
jgi:hypothetical protein